MIHFSRCCGSICSHKSRQDEELFHCFVDTVLPSRCSISLPPWHNTAYIYIYFWQCSKCPASPPSTTSHRPTQVRRKPRCHRRRCCCADLRGDAGRLHLIIFPSSQGCFPWFPAQTRIAEAFSHELQHKLDHLKTYPPWPHRPDWHAACCIRFFLANATRGRL